MRDVVILLLEGKRLFPCSFVFAVLKTDVSFTVYGATLEDHCY